MSDLRRPHRTRVVIVASIVVVLVALMIGGVRGAPAGTPLGTADKVVVVAVPGLRWADLEAVDTPHLDALIGSSAVLSVQAIGTGTGVLEGYLSVGAGNRLEPSSVPPTGDSAAVCAADLIAVADTGESGSTGAVAGALGQALAAAGTTRAVYGSDAALAALMDRRGCVDRRGSPADVSFDADVTLLELGGLERSTSAGARVEAVADLDRRLGAIELPPDAAVMLVAPSNVDEAAGVTVVAWRGGDSVSGSSLQSPSTRRAGYLTLNDLGPTLLAARGVAAPSSMNGTVAVESGSVEAASTQVAERADIADRVAFRDQTITPVAGIVLFGVLVTLAAWARGRSRSARGAAAVTVAVVVSSFGSGAVAYHHLPRWVYLVVLVVAAVALAAVAASIAAVVSASAAEIVVAVLWTLFVIDLVGGGALQLTTPLGYTPTVAGRFQGLGNLAFALFAAAAVGVACSPSTAAAGQRTSGRWQTWRRLGGMGWVAVVGAVTAVMVATPRYGSDVGGTLAIVPTMSAVALVLSRRRVGWRPVALVGVCTVGLVVVAGVVDHLRPAPDQTHLGRFVARLRRGEAGEILQRKIESNLSLITAGPWPLLFCGLVVLALALVWRHREQVRARLAGDVGLRAAVVGFAVLGVLGFALNDSGIAVPAVMCAVAVPWIVVQVVPIATRERR